MKKWSIRLGPWLWMIFILITAFHRGGELTGVDCAIALGPLIVVKFLSGLLPYRPHHELQLTWGIIRTSRVPLWLVAALFVSCVIGSLMASGLGVMLIQYLVARSTGPLGS